MKYTLYYIATFIVGGGLITLLTVLSEKVEQRVAGVIISIPSTIVLSYVFIGLYTNDEVLKSVAGWAPISLIGTLFFVFIYINLSKFFSKLTFSIAISSLVVFIAWSLFSALILMSLHMEYIYSALLYLFIVAIITKYFSKKQLSRKIKNDKRLTLPDVVFRFLFSGTIIMVSTLLAKLVNTFWGSVFSVFPVTYYSSLVIYQRNIDDINDLFFYARNIPLGSLSLLVFSLSVFILIEPLGFILTIIVSLLLSFVTSFFIYKVITFRKNKIEL